MKIRNMLSCLRTPGMGLAISLLLADPSRATVSDIASNGFTLKIETQIAASPEKVYATLIEPARWWSPDHTFSGDANNLHLEARAGGCWCETLPNGGSVTHLTVVYVSPGKALRLRGALGPSQGLAVTGALTWKLEPAADGTHVSVTYALGGYNNGGFTELAKAVDGVLTAQVDRLKKAVESKSPVSH